MTDSELQSGPSEPMLLADHLALDLLNTEAGAGERHIDFWCTGDDVSHWLQRCGIEVGNLEQSDKGALLASAKDLRATTRELVELRKHGEQGDPERLNRYLALQQSVPVLEWTNEGVSLVRRNLLQSPLQPLGKVAEAVADLLAQGEFDLVRQCEHPDCVMWFYDRTKSRRRRWCSMALCGNRYKAAEFRKRRQSEK